MGYTPQLWMALPFVVLLTLIALGPLFFERWWLKHYPKVCFGLGAITVAYYLFALPAPATHKVVHTGVEYISFITLIGSLFVVSGGIHINVKGEATPLANVTFLLIGAIIANVLGTTGASMLLIRPWLRMNKYRITAHHVVFFILIVSNVGGCLTPIGDPPLFLGYLRGVPFWWVAEHCWPMWLVGVCFLLVVFWMVDYRNYLRAPAAVRKQLAEPTDHWRFEGLANIVFLLVILGAVFINRPTFLREMLMIGAALGSWFTTRKAVHDANHFNFHPIREVAILFVGIFATMIPALDWLQANAGRLQAPTPALFYWGTGTLSSLLDNAPTYLSFLTAAIAMFVNPDIISQVQHLIQSGAIDLASASEPVQNTYAALKQYFGQRLSSKTLTPEDIQMAYLLGNVKFNHYIVAISVSAVFFGANTYIGNGPNFMVKAIADHQKVHTPTFLGYIWKYTVPIMIPMLILVWLLFFR
jgi:Na+/H+ antiporter NhaD/arsenite permease-like protein